MISLAGSLKVKFIIILAITSILSAHQYIVSIFGIPIVDVKMSQNNATSLSFETKTVGIFNTLWPTNNKYSVVFDSTTFGIQSYEKDINQGEFNQSLSADYNYKTQTLDYKDGPSISLDNSCKTILTLLAWVQNPPSKRIDAKWLPMEHEGDLYEFRLLLADTPYVHVLDDSTLTDHYRLDLKLKESGKFLDRTDYFMENIVMPGMVKQLWIEHEYPYRIIQASVSVWNLDVKALLNE